MDSAAPKKSASWNPRPVHRIIGSIILIFTLYFAVTGTVIQLVDLHGIFTHAPATNTEMVQMREGLNGPGNYVVIQPGDYGAMPLPDGFDYTAAFTTVLQGVRAKVGDAGLKFLELRVVDGKPIGIARVDDKSLRFDPATGAALPNPPKAAPDPPSIHLAFKIWHVFRPISNLMTLLNALTGIGLFAMVVTGLTLYFRLLRTRSRAGLKGFFWTSGGVWRSLHRGVSILAAVFLLFVSVTGTMLALDTLGLGIYQLTHKDAGKYARFPAGAIADFSSPLPNAKLPAMLQTTLSAGHGTSGAAPVKVVRLRYFNSIPQGILIAGSGNDTAQFVFNAETGKRMSLTEPEYPKTHYKLGWKEHEMMKKIHRGDAFGVPGRLMDLFAGLSLIYLSISGGVMYVDLLRKRRRAGRTALFWT